MQSRSLPYFFVVPNREPSLLLLSLTPAHPPVASDPTQHPTVSVLELTTLKKAFLSSAVDNVLSRAQLASVFSDVGFGPVPSDRMFDLFDKDGNGTVSP